MADGTSNSLGAKRWANFQDDASNFTLVTITSDNAVTLPIYFPVPARLKRLAFLASTAVVSTTAVAVEVYKNTSTLLGTWTICGANVGVAVNKVATVDLGLYDLDGTTNADGSVTQLPATQYDMEAGEWLHIKVVSEASATGIGQFSVEYIERPVHGTATTGVAVEGTWA